MHKISRAIDIFIVMNKQSMWVQNLIRLTQPTRSYNNVLKINAKLIGILRSLHNIYVWMSGMNKNTDTTGNRRKSQFICPAAMNQQKQSAI